MKDKLRGYIDSLFSDAPKTRRAYELREELLSNLIAKYDDMIAQGRTEEEAYQSAVAGIGDVSELIHALNGDNVLDKAQADRDRRTSAITISVSVMLYIISIIPILILQDLRGVVVMFAIAAVATGLIIYSAMSRPKYQKADDTLVEEFKEWKSGNSDKARLRKSISSALWPLIVVIYFMVSFIYGAWAFSWIIFILGAAIENIIKLIFDFKE